MASGSAQRKPIASELHVFAEERVQCGARGGDEVVVVDDIEGLEEIEDDEGDEGGGEHLVLEESPARVAPVAPIDKVALLRRDVYHGLVHCIVSNPKLWKTVDVEEVKQLMEAPLRSLPAGALALTPLWQYMLDKGTPRAAAAETLVFFHSRAERWGVAMELPVEIDSVEVGRRSAVVESMSARGVTTGTFVGRAPVPLDAEAAQAARAMKRAKAKRLQQAADARRRTGASLMQVVRTGLGLCCVLALAVGALHEPSHTSLEVRAAAALGPTCASVEQDGRAMHCVTTLATLGNASGIHERRDFAESTLDIVVIFVTAEGEPLALE